MLRRRTLDMRRRNVDTYVPTTELTYTMARRQHYLLLALQGRIPLTLRNDDVERDVDHAVAVQVNERLGRRVSSYPMLISWGRRTKMKERPLKIL